jgi:pilus assembly protein CpaC
MANRTLTRAAALWALTVSGLASISPAVAADTANMPVVKMAASEATSRFVALGIGAKSVAIDLPADIKDVLVADPKSPMQLFALLAAFT